VVVVGSLLQYFFGGWHGCPGLAGRIITDGILRTCQGGQITIDDNAIKAIVTGVSTCWMRFAMRERTSGAERQAWPLTLFSTGTEDARLLDPSDQFAAPREGDPLPVQIEEADKNFAVGLARTYRIDAAALLDTEKGSRRIRNLLGYLT
jgi:hypothetical protein